MDWTQFLLLIATFVGLFAWNRAESRADSRHMDTKIEASRAETRAMLEASNIETRSILQAIHDEMKDFHGRLCAIEASKKGKV